MKKSTKAVLLSAFIFPGAGQIYLKRYISGVALIGVSFVAVFYLVSKILERAIQIVEKIQSGEIQPDIQAIAELVATQSAGADTQLLNTATVAFIICWLIGIIDAYRKGTSHE